VNTRQYKIYYIHLIEMLIYSQSFITLLLLLDFTFFCFGIAPLDGFRYAGELLIKEANSERFNLELLKKQIE